MPMVVDISSITQTCSCLQNVLLLLLLLFLSTACLVEIFTIFNSAIFFVCWNIIHLQTFVVVTIAQLYWKIEMLRGRICSME